MVFHKLVLSDGTEIKSNKIMSTSYKSSVTDNQNVSPGEVCGAEIEMTLWGEAGSEKIDVGSVIQFYRIRDDGTEILVATLNAEKPTRASANTYQIIAYDNVTKLDKDMSEWLISVQESFPMTLQSFVEMVCAECGLDLANDYIDNGDYLLQSFSVTGITAREIMQWAGQAAGQFVRATPEGKIEFAWYKKNTTALIGVGDIDTTLDVIPFYSGTLSYEDYTVAAVEKVQIRQGEEDVGTVYPTDLESGNTYIIEANGMLANDTASNLIYIAQNVYQRLSAASYTPMRVDIPFTEKINVGDIVTVVDSNGVEFTSYITGCVASGSKMSLESVGNPRRDSVSTINATQIKSLKGKVFNLSMTVDGLKTEAKDAADNITKLQQTAGQVSVTAQSEQGTLKTIISNDGTWKSTYTDANGNELSGIAFDFTLGAFVFKGAGTFTGELNIGNGKFVVDEVGNLFSKGTAEIIGGKFYSMNADGTTGDCFEITSDGLIMRKSDTFLPAFYISKGEEDGGIYPFIMLCNSVNDEFTETDFPCMIRRFADGIWIGNPLVYLDDNNCFKSDKDAVGIFVSLKDKTTYAVSGTDMRSFYTGETIARFG